MIRKHLRHIAGVAAMTLPATLLVVVVGASAAYSHGYTTSPVSRALHCKQGTVTGCGPIQWEPQSVEGPKGFPSGGPRDGTICAAGDSRWAPLDDPRNGSWPAASVQSGQTYNLNWTLTAAHATTRFEYYITRDGWNPSQPLTRAQLDLQPFHTVSYGGQRPPNSVSHSARLPNKSGRHMILSVWVIADTGNAFYQCADVSFGSVPPTDPPACEASPWSSGTAYNGGARVAHNGRLWEAQWWTRGEEPGTTGQWGVWRDVGPC